MLAIPLLAAAALAGSPVSLGTAANGRTVHVASATPIVVTLPSNASTGFRWKIASPLDVAVLRLVGHAYKPSASKLVGAPGIEVWRFRTVGSGAFRLRLAYLRPWAPSQVARRFAVDFRVS